jgi:hypothetical protein
MYSKSEKKECSINLSNSQAWALPVSRKSRRKFFIVCGVVTLLLFLLEISANSIKTLIHSNKHTLTRRAQTTKQWKPKAGLTWNLLLLKPLSSGQTNNTQVLDIDLFDNDEKIIKSLKQNGAKVICYFSAGSYEKWRPDAKEFNKNDLGSPLDGWPGEWWINVKSTNVRNIMKARLDLAVKKGCDAVDPDNVDGYNNKNGLGLTKKDATNYMNFLAKEAHKRKLAIGLKNAGEIVGKLVEVMDFSVNEQCEQYNECDTFKPFIKKNKPVFHVEYPKGDDTNNDVNIPEAKKQQICNDSTTKGFSTIIKNINLDSWIQTC